ncbi:UNVERIFIED_CONTAM: hypothetical protein Sradi_1744700 [Sesamum radiatum]|uniref:Integrase catalytic domain-containing protein n=1 Tax=Sesamum radiatum TaxID=300843 RepID=A0AAW2TSZ9_SESRA
MALALVITARKLHPYFLSYHVGIRTNTPLKQVLGKAEASGRLVKWAIELSEYDISYLSRTIIKAQVLVDFVSNMTRTTQEEVFKEKPWILHVDGSSTTQRSEARWGMDIVGLFPLTPGQRKFLLVTIDYFTKWVEAEPLARITEGEVMKFIWKNIICRFGLSQKIISDNSREEGYKNGVHDCS